MIQRVLTLGCSREGQGQRSGSALSFQALLGHATHAGVFFNKNCPEIPVVFPFQWKILCPVCGFFLSNLAMVGKVDPDFPVRFGLSDTGNRLPPNRAIVPTHVYGFHLKPTAYGQDDIGVIGSLHEQASVGVELQLTKCLFHLIVFELATIASVTIAFNL